MKVLNIILPERLPYASDSEINSSFTSLKSKLRSVGENWIFSKDPNAKSQGLYLETEICYLQRELMWRKKREVKHREYLSTKNTFPRHSR
tara:strand:+ start:5605 stop:5874 length:270 start_codon:yes stop_codon:yes gene_type:complete